jgi:hypothetical protein
MIKRDSWMMPTPFVLNDAVVIKQKIKPSPVVVDEQAINPKIESIVKKDSLTVVKDSIKVK